MKKRTKVVTVPQPFATLASLGMMSMICVRFGIKPGTMAIHSGQWTDWSLAKAKDLELVLRSVGIKSRKLMPIGNILGFAEVYDAEWVSDAKLFRSRHFSSYNTGIDDEQYWQDSTWALKLSSVNPFINPFQYVPNKINPVLNLSEMDELAKMTVGSFEPIW